MEWCHLANLIRMGLHHQLLSKGFEMKQIIITSTMLMLATNAFAQSLPITTEQMKSEMEKSTANAREWTTDTGARMCPPDIEYVQPPYKAVCGEDTNIECYNRRSEEAKIRSAYNAWTKACYNHSQPHRAAGKAR